MQVLTPGNLKYHGILVETSCLQTLKMAVRQNMMRMTPQNLEALRKFPYKAIINAHYQTIEEYSDFNFPYKAIINAHYQTIEEYSDFKHGCVSKQRGVAT
jgi:hypothetical protein